MDTDNLFFALWNLNLSIIQAVIWLCSLNQRPAVAKEELFYLREETLFPFLSLFFPLSVSLCL